MGMYSIEYKYYWFGLPSGGAFLVVIHWFNQSHMFRTSRHLSCPRNLHCPIGTLHVFLIHGACLERELQGERHLVSRLKVKVTVAGGHDLAGFALAAHHQRGTSFHFFRDEGVWETPSSELVVTPNWNVLLLCAGEGVSVSSGVRTGVGWHSYLSHLKVSQELSGAPQKMAILCS